MAWEDYRVFRAVLATGGLGSAGSALGLSHATVRRHVERLEYRLESALFTHSPQGLTPTAAALALAPAIERAAGAASAFERLATAAVDEVRGAVRVVAEPLVAMHFLPPLWETLGQSFPDLNLQIGLNPLWEELLTGGADIAVTTLDPTAEDLDCRRATGMRAGLFAHRSLVERHGAPASLRDLPDFPMVGPYERARVQPLLDPVGLSADDLDIVYRSSDRPARVTAVRAGVGIGFIPLFMALRDRELVRILPEASVDFEVWVAMRRELIGVRRMTVVRDALVGHLHGLAVEDTSSDRLDPAP